MRHADLLAALLPPESYDPAGTFLRAELAAEGAALDFALQRSNDVANAITPWLAGELIADWERVLGLTPAGGYQQRMSAVLAKIAETGGLSIPYFKSLAAQLGYTIEIVELQPFWVDYSHVDRDLIYDEGIIWAWQVVVSGSQSQKSYAFYVDASCVGDRLLSFSDPVIESVFEDLKPAHTFVYFAYQ